MRLFSYILSGIALLASILPLLDSPYWWIRMFDFPRMQIAVILLISLILSWLFIRSWWPWKAVWLGVLMLAVVYQAKRMIIYTPLYPPQAKSSNDATTTNTFRLMISNVRMENRQAKVFLQLVRKHNPDLLLVNEPDRWWMQQLKSLEDSYPYRLTQPQSNTYGMALYSRLPFTRQQIHFLVHKNVPSFEVSVVLASQDTFDLYCLHPKPPKHGVPSYERDTELLIVGKTIRKRNKAAVLAGDLNDVAWSRTSRLFQRYSHLVDPRQGRGLYNTYSVFVPLFRYPLDHVFYSREFGLKKMKRLENIGSDHFPMLVELSYEPGTANTRGRPTLKDGDRKKIKEKVSKVIP